MILFKDKMAVFFRGLLRRACKRICIVQWNNVHIHKESNRGNGICIIGASAVAALLMSIPDMSTCTAIVNSEGTSTIVAAESLIVTDASNLTEDKINSEKFLSALRRIVGEDQIELDDEECKQRGKPWSSYHKIVGHPRVIVSPSTTEEVCACTVPLSHHLSFAECYIVSIRSF